MNLHKIVSALALLSGLLVTAFFLLAIVPKLISSISANGITELVIGVRALSNWYDNPVGFFFSYLVGYLVIWKNKLIGSLIILCASAVVTIVNLNNLGWVIFTLPAAAVGILHLIQWNQNKKV